MTVFLISSSPWEAANRDFAGVMPQARVISALGAGERGYLLWRTTIRWVSIPLTFIVLLGGLL